MQGSPSADCVTLKNLWKTFALFILAVIFCRVQGATVGTWQVLRVVKIEAVVEMVASAETLILRQHEAGGQPSPDEDSPPQKPCLPMWGGTDCAISVRD